MTARFGASRGPVAVRVLALLVSLGAVGAGCWTSLPVGGGPSAPRAVPVVPLSRTGGGNASNGTGPTLNYTVTFLSSGLPTGLSWSVQLDGLEESTNGSSIAFARIPAGPATFTVFPPAGYSASPSNGTLDVDSDLRQAIAFVGSSSGPTGFLGIPTTELVVIVVLVVGGLGAVAAIEARERRRSGSSPPPPSDP